MFLNDASQDCVVRLSTTLANEHVAACVSCYDASDFAWRICDEKWRTTEYGSHARKVMGLVFADPNGSPDWPALEMIAGTQQYRQLDFLVNVNATSIKRCRNSPLCKGYRLLSESIAALGKKHVYVWAPHRSNSWQFALVFATNWNKFPEFSRSGFWRIDSPEGQKIFNRLNYTQKELCA